MAYVYPNVDQLEDSEMVGSKQCVALVQHYAHAPVTSAWKQGAHVRDNKTIQKGTAVATFVNGKYPNHASGNHAAFYVSQNHSGVHVMDQWADDPNKPKVSERLMRFKGKHKDGTYVDPSNNGDALFIIE